jgi:ABC-type nitrate/sulfonate/bicarbonate transport system ATPase subunit
MNAPAQLLPALTIRNLSKGFKSNGADFLPVLRDIQLDVRPSECIAIVGSSGTGKSTLLRLIAGLEKVGERDTGEILLAGKPPTRLNGRIGFVFQSYSTFPWLTVRENVLQATRSSRVLRSTRAKEADRQIASVRLNDFKQFYPQQLSGGQRQRLAFACALAMRPMMLLLDEPMGALDALTREHLQIELISLWLASKHTTLLVTHDISEALLLGHRILVLSGRPASIIKEVDAILRKPWLERANMSTAEIESAARDIRNSREFLELSDELRDALG